MWVLFYHLSLTYLIVGCDRVYIGQPLTMLGWIWGNVGEAAFSVLCGMLWSRTQAALYCASLDVIYY